MKRWSLNTKIYSLIGILIFTAALISYMAVTKLGTLNKSMHQLTDGPVKRQKLLLDIQGSFFLQLVNEKNILLASNDNERSIHEERFKERHERLMRIYNEVYPDLIPKNQANLKLFLDAYNEFLLLHDRIEKLSHDKKIVEAAELSMIEGRVIRLKAEEKIKVVMDVNVELVKNTLKSSDNLYESAKISLALLSLISILISAVLDASIQKVQGIVDETRRSVDRLVHEGKLKVDSGTMIAHQCGSVLEEIVRNVSKVSGMADEISSSCQEQALGVQEITKAMHQLDQVTQANAQTSVQTSNAADDLSSQANSLRRQVDSLIETVMGNEVAKAA